MAKTKKTTPRWLLFPWGMITIITILVIGEAFPDWIQSQASWIMVTLIIPVAIVESVKSGYSVLRVMYSKTLWTALSLFVVGAVSTLWVTKCALPFGGSYYTFDRAPWQVYLTIVVIVGIELVNLFVMLKAGMREWSIDDSDHD